jgi:predicted lipid-binding transport protein (Tim44 family)
MGSSLIQLLVLAGVAVFLIIKLRSVLGTRQGFEKPPLPLEGARPSPQRSFEVIEGGPDRDIADHVAEGSEAAAALAAMKRVESSFSVGTFLQGARGAYEMILIAFDKGEMDKIKPFLSDEVHATFAEAVADREAKGLTIEANFIGIRDLALHEATFDPATNLAEIAVRFTAEMTSVVRDKSGAIVEGSTSEIKRQRDIWTFSRIMGSDNPNWQLTATED